MQGGSREYMCSDSEMLAGRESVRRVEISKSRGTREGYFFWREGSWM